MGRISLELQRSSQRSALEVPDDLRGREPGAMGQTFYETQFDSRQGPKVFLSSKRPDRTWVPISYLFSGQMERCQQRYRGRGVKLTTHFHLEPNLIMTRAIIYPHIWLMDEHRKIFNLYVNIGISIMMDPGSGANDCS